jgi:putative superfamily III holin-X
MATMESSNRPLSDLLGGLINDISMLFRKEVELARTEAAEKIGDAMGASRNLAIGGVLAIGATGVFLAALVTGLAALLVAAGMDPNWANFVSAIIITVIVGAIAWMLIARGMAALKASNLSMPRTAGSIQADATAARESM